MSENRTEYAVRIVYNDERAEDVPRSTRELAESTLRFMRNSPIVERAELLERTVAVSDWAVVPDK